MIKIQDCIPVFMETRICNATIVKCGDISGAEPGDFIECSDCITVILLRVIGESFIKPRIGQERVYIKGSVECSYSLIISSDSEE